MLVDPVFETFHDPSRRASWDGRRHGRPRDAQARRDRPRGGKRLALSCATWVIRSPTSARSGPTGSKGPVDVLPRLIERVLANDAVELA